MIADHNPPFISGQQHKTLYRVAGTLALMIALAGLTDAVTSMGREALDNRSVAMTEWFTMFQTQPFDAFSRLGVINILTLSLGLPIYLAFNQVFRKERPVLAAFASILYFMGTAIYLSSNIVFPLFALSRQYALASAAQKPLVEAAGQALLAQGADLTPGTFFGLFFTQVAGLLITSAILRGTIFSKWAGYASLAGFGLMIFFFTLTAFFPEQYDIAMFIAAPGALLLMAYQLMLARRFYQLSTIK